MINKKLYAYEKLSTAGAMSREDWKDAASQLLRVEMLRNDLTFKDLSRRLAHLGVDLEGAQLSNKVNRGTFSVIFFLQCMRAMNVQVIRLFDDEISRLKTFPAATDEERVEKSEMSRKVKQAARGKSQ